MYGRATPESAREPSLKSGYSGALSRLLRGSLKGDQPPRYFWFLEQPAHRRWGPQLPFTRRFTRSKVDTDPKADFQIHPPANQLLLAALRANAFLFAIFSTLVEPRTLP